MKIRVGQVKPADTVEILKILNTEVNKGQFPPFIIAGGLACNWYAEACTTRDLDIFIDSGYISAGRVLSPYGFRLTEDGYYELGSIKLDINYAKEGILKEMYYNTLDITLGSEPVKIARPEYIIARYFEIEAEGEDKGRSDLTKIIYLFRDTDINWELLEDLLTRYRLWEVYIKYDNLYHFKEARDNYGEDTSSEIGQKKAKYHKVNARLIGQEKIDQIDSLYEIEYQSREIREQLRKERRNK